MKRPVVLLFVFFVSLSVFSQDLIVTNEGDSINCRIIKVKSDNIYFLFRNKLEVKTSQLPLSKTDYHQYNFYTKSLIPKDWNTGIGREKRFQISVDGGLTYRIAKFSEDVPPDLYEYMQKLRLGFNFGTSLTYYPSESYGFGLNYHHFNASNSIDNIYLEDLNGNRRKGRLADNIGVSFYGGFFTSRLRSSNKQNSLLFRTSVGYMEYKNDCYVIDHYNISGGTVGFGVDFGYDYEIAENFLVGIQLSLVTGTLSKYQISDGRTVQTVVLEKGNYESLSRIDLTIGIRFAL
jgi:hypothetical protein